MILTTFLVVYNKSGFEYNEFEGAFSNILINFFAIIEAFNFKKIKCIILPVLKFFNFLAFIIAELKASILWAGYKLQTAI